MLSGGVAIWSAAIYRRFHFAAEPLLWFVEKKVAPRRKDSGDESPHSKLVAAFEEGVVFVVAGGDVGDEVEDFVSRQFF